MGPFLAIQTGAAPSANPLAGYIIGGAFSLVFLIWGTIVLVRGRITVTNPRHRSAFGPGLMGSFLARAFEADPYAEPTIEARGAGAAGMGVLFLVLGLAFAAAVALNAYLDLT